MKRIVIVLAAFLAGCAPGEHLRSGDLVFQLGEGDFSKAVEESTCERTGFTHVGIVEKSRGDIFIIEATPENGVTLMPLGDFLEESAHTPEGAPEVVFMRADLSAKDARRAARRAHLLLGRPYDIAFAPGDSALYCSELVWECFLRNDGSHLFDSVAMNFRDSTGSIHPYWERHFNALGLPVPQGTPGTNPDDLSKSPALRPLETDSLPYGLKKENRR